MNSLPADLTGQHPFYYHPDQMGGWPRQEVLTAMLDTGIGYDIIIKCGGRKWYLHKDVLKAGSRWFKAAFEGDFAESRKRKITLHEVDPVQFDWVVKYLYGTEAETLFNLIGIRVPHSIVLLHDIADYFAVGTLVSYAAEKLGRHLPMYIIPEFWEAVSSNHPIMREFIGSLKLPTWYRDSLFRAIDIVFREDRPAHRMQNYFLYLFSKYGDLLVLDKDTKAKIEARPHFARKVFGESPKQEGERPRHYLSSSGGKPRLVCPEWD